MKKIFVHGDALQQLKRLKSDFFQMVVTSPPYFNVVDYKCAGQIGLNQSLGEYIQSLVDVFTEARRVLKKTGVLFLVIGDTYAGGGRGGGGSLGKERRFDWDSIPRFKSGLPKGSLMGVPWRVAFALQESGWILKQDIIWSSNRMPESAKRRCSRSHEYVFILAKHEDYFFNGAAIKEVANSPAERRNRKKEGLTRNYAHGERFSEGERQWGDGEYVNRKSVWYVPLQPIPDRKHPATFPEELAEICILAGTQPGDWVLDCFSGHGTSLIIAEKLGRHSLGIDLNKEYLDNAKVRKCK